MTTCQKDQLFSRRMFVVVMIAGRKLDVYHLTLCLDERGKGLGGVEGQVKFGKGRCYENTTRVVAGAAVGPHGCNRNDVFGLELGKR